MPGEDPHLAGRAVSGGHDDSGSDGRHGRLRPRGTAVRRSSWLLSGATCLGGIAVPLASANGATGEIAGLSFGTYEVMQTSVFAGVLGAALLSAIWLIRERTRVAGENIELRSQVADLNASLHRSEALLNVRDQRVIVWAADSRKPELLGTLPPGCGAPEDRGSFLAFGRWLTPRSAAALEHAVADLREKGRNFDLVIETQAGTPLEIQGRKSTQHVFARFVSLSEAQHTGARMRLENQQLVAENDLIIGLLDALDMPFWLRRADGKLKWVNKAYAAAVEAVSPAVALQQDREFLGTQAREAIARKHDAQAVFEQTLSTVIGGDRRMFLVTDYAAREGSAGIALDQSEIEHVRAEYERTVRSHADTLDHLNTAVAIFDADEKLRFFNQAFQKLWDLDQPFLESAPDNALLLDRLRADGKIAEQPEWRGWKQSILTAYRAVDSQEHLWHLPDGRTLRVVANTQPKGGVTWVFENLTEKFDLESRYNTAVKVQRETLDNLAEGVAVFGPDGRARLSNPAFATLWGIEPSAIGPGAHISEIRALCDAIVADSPWGGFVASVTGFDDERRDVHGQTELKNGTVLRHAVINLPNGQVMMTFVDVTDSVNVERALKESNEALLKADKLKNDFVQHVSYELRSPLTNIIGFTELLLMPGSGENPGPSGPLSPRQREYIDHISSSSSVLLTIVNDILDLATVDAGIMELEIGEVRIDQTMNAAAELVADRLREHSIELALDYSRAPRTFDADENRVRQVLFNLLSNAANYAPEGSRIALTCALTGTTVEFSVHDDGPGIAPEVREAVFRRFERQSNGGRRRGAGLGLSIVKSFVELHGGAVEIATGPDRGTTVICRFPLSPSGARAAAE
jgi:signal transduction histidine kinase